MTAPIRLATILVAMTSLGAAGCGAALASAEPALPSSESPGKATNPNPAHGVVGVAPDTQLTWTAGSGATSYRIQFGTTAPGLYRGAQTATLFDPGWLAAGVTCFWRIDSVNATGVTTGDVWSFTTQPDAYFADFDEDGDVDQEDFGHFQRCLSGPAVPQPDPDCQDTRLDDDADVDHNDFGLLANCLSGANGVPPLACGASSMPDGPIPVRPAGAMTGSAFVTEVMDLALSAREQRIWEEISAGNLPEFLRGFVAINVSATIGGTPHSATYYVMPDYLCIGSDVDFVRMPMRPGTAQAIADRFECLLTTRKMVNDIYAQAAIKLAPAPISPDTTDITLVSTFYQHHLMIEAQRAGYPLGPLIGGIKKDVVVTPLLASNPDRVAIYGWHRLNGVPIQPLYVGHIDTWVDYSHGIRLVKGYMTLDGAPVAVADVLRDPDLCVLLSDEGPVDNPRY